MLPWLLILFVSVPIAEIALFIEVGELYGLWPTVGAIFATAAAGSLLIRYQGLAVLREVQANVDAGHLPARPLFDGFCLLFAGAMLLTPGFITDGIGFILLFPPARTVIAVFFLRRLEARFTAESNDTHGPVHEAGRKSGHGQGPVIIDGDFEEVGSKETADDNDREPPILPGPS